jgi:hypothetical protein
MEPLIMIIFRTVYFWLADQSLMYFDEAFAILEQRTSYFSVISIAYHTLSKSLAAHPR